MTYALETPQFNSGMLAHYLTTELGRMGKAAGLALLLLAKVNWQSDESFGPRGTINHLTVRKMADALGCSPSTVHDHLAILREAGIIGSEPVSDAKGAIRYCRLWFTGFLNWLQERFEAGVAPSKPSGGGGSEKPERNHNNKTQKIIDLDEVKSVKFGPLEDMIRRADPKLASGDRADCQLVFDKFRSYNMRKGTTQIGVAALIGFAKRFTEFQRPKAPSYQPAAAKVTRAAPVAAAPKDEDPAKAALRKHMDPCVFKAWIERLTFRRTGSILTVVSSTSFIKSHVSQHFADEISRAAGPAVQVEFR
ncbi:DnaA N-terminal domain-containing protein [Pontitalea aquivivens]|uniref:DnaA N-terminal domain-containing protein n=1 Tax=Pontitalea aquivivens TaxID=3388663 RepID=UPI003970CA26